MEFNRKIIVSIDTEVLDIEKAAAFMRCEVEQVHVLLQERLDAVAETLRADMDEGVEDYDGLRVTVKAELE